MNLGVCSKVTLVHFIGGISKCSTSQSQRLILFSKKIIFTRFENAG